MAVRMEGEALLLLFLLVSFASPFSALHICRHPPTPSSMPRSPPPPSDRKIFSHKSPLSTLQTSDLKSYSRSGPPIKLVQVDIYEAGSIRWVCGLKIKDLVEMDEADSLRAADLSDPFRSGLEKTFHLKIRPQPRQ